MHLGVGALVSIGLFVGLYLVLVTEWVHRAVAALSGAALAVAFGLISPGGAGRALDLNTLLLLLALMILVAVLEQEGLFVFIAERAERWGGGSPRRILLIFMVLVAVVSAFLPNVTVILMLGPTLISLAEGFGLKPIPILILGVVASNLGGMATLVGDPPNILIGTAAQFSFLDFVRYLGPLAVILAGLTILRVTRRETTRAVAGEDHEPIFPHRRSHHFGWLGAIALLTVTSFVLQPWIGMPIGLLGLIGALLAVVVVGSDFDTLLTRVDWSTIIFFGGLFVVVGAMVQQGVVTALASWILERNFGSMLPILVMVGTAILSALLDNLPIVAAMIPLVDRLTASHPGYFPALFIALAIGAAVGGNATLYGSAANVVAGSLAKARGYRLSFSDWTRTAAPLTAGLVAVAAVWMWVGGFVR